VLDVANQIVEQRMAPAAVQCQLQVQIGDPSAPLCVA
jgi:hypothetical protein